MNIAYIILAHKYPRHLGRLVEKLTYKQNHFFIHIDARAKMEDYTAVLPFDEKIHYVQKREKAVWGSFRLVQATLNALEEVNRLPVDFDFVCLLSGQDYPVKSNAFIEAFFSARAGDNFMTYRTLPSEGLNYGGMHRIESYTFTLRGRSETYLPSSYAHSLNRKGKSLNFLLGLYCAFKKKRAFPKGMVPYYGSQWWCLNKEAVDYILLFLEQNRDYIAYHRHTLIPDEIFFQSILINAKGPMEKLPVNDNLRFMVWEESANGPNVLQGSDLKPILRSGALFARKFNEQESRELLEALDREIMK